MAVRFVDGGFEYLDPMSGASSVGGEVVYDDGQRPAPWEDGPGYGINDAIASEALRWMAVPAEQILMTRPPVPQRLFPPRWGYSQEPLTVDDIFYNDEMWAPRPRIWAWPPSATVADRTRPPITDQREEGQEWSGSERNMSGPVHPTM